MNRLAQPSIEWAKISLLAVGRRPSMVVFVLLAMLATGSGVFLEAFNFGEQREGFLQRIGWALRVLIGGVVALAIGVQVSLSNERSGLIPVAQARGISPIALLLGQSIAIAAVATVFAAGSGAVVWLVSGATNSSGFSGWVMSSAMLAVSGLLIGLIVQWLSSFGREPGFLIGATLGIVMLGYLRPLAVDVGGMAAWLCMLAPDFAWLGDNGWGQGDYSWGAAVRAIASGAMYAAVLGWLSRRGWERREF